MLATGSLTNSPTSLFWLTVGILVFTVVIVAIGVITWRSTTTRKKILLTITSRSQLLSAPQSMRDDLQIKLKDEPIQGNPYVTALELANVGRSPIRSDDFDSKRSLQFTLDVKIIKHLSTEHSPSSAPKPTVTATDTAFSLAPELIAKGEIIKIALLTEGKPSRVETTFSPFGEVTIEIGDREAQAAKQRRRSRVLNTAAGATVLLAAVALIWTLTSELDKADNSLNTTFGFSVCETLQSDLNTTSSALQLAASQTLAIQSSQSQSKLLIASYRQLLTDAQGDLVNLPNDYSTVYIYYSAPEPTNIPSAIQRASTIINEMIKEKKISIAPTLANELASEQKFISSSAAFPKQCVI
jgi:hypothetical protein